MPAKKPPNTFVKIRGFKRIIKCRKCGKKVLTEKYSRYCKHCLREKNG